MRRRAARDPRGRDVRGTGAAMARPSPRTDDPRGNPCVARDHQVFSASVFPGYPRDLFEFLSWGEVMTRSPALVYDPQVNCRYLPGYLYAMWAAVGLARALNFGPEVTGASVSTLRVFVRFPPIVADFFLGLTVFAWMKMLSGERRGPGAVMLLALNPALLFTSVAWGQ